MSKLGTGRGGEEVVEVEWLEGERRDRRVLGAFVNVQALTAAGECQKLGEIVSWLESENEDGYDFVVLAETHHQQWERLRSLPFFLSSSTWQGKHEGGVCVLMRTWLKAKVNVLTAGVDWVKFGTPEWRVGGVYLRPLLTPSLVEQRLTELGDCEVVIGDFNIERKYNTVTPFDRYQIIRDWMNRGNLEWQDIQGSCVPKLDHVFAKKQQRVDACAIEAASLPFRTDHPLLTIILPSSIDTANSSSNEPGIRRYRISKLDDPNVAKRFREGVEELVPVLESESKRAWEKIRVAKLDEEKQKIIDGFERVITMVLEVVGEEVLGTYNSSEIRIKRDEEGERLKKCEGLVEAIRAWRRSMRGVAKPVVAVNPQKTVEEEVMNEWKGVFGGDEDFPDKPDFEGREFRETGALAKLFTEKTLLAAIKKASKASSAGVDSIHIRMIAEVCYSVKRTPQPRIQRKSAPPPLFPTHIPALIPTQPPSNSNLSPHSPSFTPSPSPPLSSHHHQSSSTLDDSTSKFPFRDIIVSLFRMCGAASLTPSAWGEALIALISKLPSDEHPTACDLRPIALLSVFRRLFETCLLPHFTSTNPQHWAYLHPRQGGFKKGWSCQSTLLSVDHHARNSHHWTAHLDFKGAYNSPKPLTINKAFEEKGMPAEERALVWSLLVAGAKNKLIVNGKMLPEFDRTCGFPQGGPASPILFDLFIDSLLYELEAVDSNNEGLVFFFADDGTLLAVSEKVLREMLGIAFCWAQRMGMEYNVRKCAIVPPDLTLPSSPLLLLLGSEVVPVVLETKYLGLMRSAKGIDFEEYLVRVSGKMDRVLSGLKAGGFGWNPWIRRTVYRMVCGSICDYGGAFISPWIAALPRPRRKLLTPLETHHKNAVNWICGTNSARPTPLFSVTALPPPFLRFQHLTFGLSLHLHSLHPTNSIRRLLSDPNLPLTRSDLIHRIRDDIIFRRFNKENARLAKLPPSNDADTVSSHDRKSFLRIELLRYFSTSVMGSYICPTSRDKALVDKVLRIKDEEDRRRAIHWRLGVFGVRLECPDCRSNFTRGCLDNLHQRWTSLLADLDGPLEPHRRIALWQATQEQARKLDREKLDRLDFALGNEEWGEVAVETLRSWERRLRNPVTRVSVVMRVRRGGVVLRARL